MKIAYKFIFFCKSSLWKESENLLKKYLNLINGFQGKASIDIKTNLSLSTNGYLYLGYSDVGQPIRGISTRWIALEWVTLKHPEMW